MTFIFMVHLSFYAIPLLIYDVMNDSTIIPKGNPGKIISKVIDISCNGRRNVLLNNYIIDKFVDTINGFVCIRIAGGHSFLWHGTPIFKCIICIQSNLELTFLHIVVFVKMSFQYIS